jgi:putative tricarboxylic transport membrane protein
MLSEGNNASRWPFDREGGAMSQAPEARFRGLVKSPFDLAGGLFLLGLAALGLAGGFNLPTGTLSGIGSGLMPRAVALLVGAFGVLLVVQSFLFEGEILEKWHLRGPVFVLGAVLVFAMLIRGSTLNFGGIFGIPVLASVKIPSLGLIVAGPLAVVISAFADKDTKPREIVVFALLMTLLCGLLFKEVLNLPIPFDPAGLIPDLVNSAYVGAKSALAHAFDAVKNLFVR